MPSSGLNELAGQIDQQNEKYVSKKKRKKISIAKNRGCITGDFCEGV